MHRIETPVFSLSALLEVDFAATYDAGALFVACDDAHWAKLAYGAGPSDAGKRRDARILGRFGWTDRRWPLGWLRLYCNGPVAAFHNSLDRKVRRFRRVFTLPGIERRPLIIGFGAQSPIGEGVRAAFDRIELRREMIVNLRDGS